MSDSRGLDDDLEGPVSPPRTNGEIVFDAPWQRRVFGLTVVACRSGACDWESFRANLIARIAQEDARPYWQSWAAAFEDVLMLTPGELDGVQHELSSRPAGFDHRD